MFPGCFLFNNEYKKFLNSLDKYVSIADSIIDKKLIAHNNSQNELEYWISHLPDQAKTIQYLHEYLDLSEIDIYFQYGINFKSKRKNIFGDLEEHNLLFIVDSKNQDQFVNYEQFAECRSDLKVFNDNWAYSRQVIPCSD